MSKALIQPQRHHRKLGWYKCEPHQAQAWAAYLGARLIGRYGAKFKAEEALANTLLRRSKPKRKVNSLGQAPAERQPIYARSLTREQYEALQSEGVLR